jgi:hypothetical protein
MGQKVFGKIFQQMYDSSVCEDWRAMVTFQQLIVLADQSGVVDMTAESISRRTNIPLEDIILPGLQKLELNDKGSRSQKASGARIVRLDEHRDWGWSIPTYEHYTFIISQEQKREYNKARMRRIRAKT